MPYEARGKCVYKKDGGAKVGCTKGDVKKYLAALHANANESINEINRGEIRKKADYLLDVLASELLKHLNSDRSNEIKTAINNIKTSDINWETDVVKSVRHKLNLLLSAANERLKKSLTEMKGGKADKLSVKDIADKHDVPVSKIEKQISMGKKVELEHTDNPAIAKEIAMDHLAEFPDYYTRLAKLEKQAEAKLGKKKVDEGTKTLIKRLMRERLK